MLVITRKLDEELIIGDDVSIRILEVHGGRTRIGVSAPQGLRVLRGELLTSTDHHQAETRRTSEPYDEESHSEGWQRPLPVESSDESQPRRWHEFAE